jgi:ATP-dependent helicase/nuclease subunit B
MAAKSLAAENTPELPWDFVYFTGFNALNQAEETIIQSLIKKRKADVLWDADTYYLENRNHEAGMFLRKYRSQWGLKEFTFVGDYFSISKKTINLYGVAKSVNQAKLAGNILKSFPQEDYPEHTTAVVLANEDLLLPVLNSIPANVGKVNITMGLPIRKTTVYGLFDAFFQLHITTLRMKSARPGMKSAFYFKDLVRFFRHPAINLLMQQLSPVFSPEAFVNKIYQSKKTFLYFETLAEMSSIQEAFSKQFATWFNGFATEPSLILPALHELSQSLDSAFRNKADADRTAIETTPWFTDFEALYSINVVIRKLDTFVSRQKKLNDLRIMFMLFQAMMRESKLVLSGEPLAGLQIMGMLETRNLDFKNLIILSANEDILPAAKSNTSLIPFDLKAYFGMPVYKEKDAIYAYHFYRLLQRAENIHIIYNTQTQDMGSSEKSRFLTQLQMEMPSWNPNIIIQEKIIPLPPAKDETDHEISIPKTDEIFDSLQLINEKGFSPTTLIHYIKCPLLFYFRHIAGIKETIVPEETIQANTLGTVVHEVLEQLYKDEGLIGEIILPEHIDRMLKRIVSVTAQKFEDIYKGGDITTGKNLLLSRVAARYVRNFLLYEKTLIIGLQEENSTLQYIKSEEQLCVDIPMPAGNIRFRGFADRIDLFANTFRIIDYKTGKVEKEELKFKEWPDIIQDTHLGKSFQLMMYAMLYSRQYGIPSNLSPGIISFRSLAEGMFTLTTPENKETGIIDEITIDHFEEQLQNLMDEIYDVNTPFTRTKDENNCANCDFRVVCNR